MGFIHQSDWFSTITRYARYLFALCRYSPRNAHLFNAIAHFSRARLFINALRIIYRLTQSTYFHKLHVSSLLAHTFYWCARLWIFYFRYNITCPAIYPQTMKCLNSSVLFAQYSLNCALERLFAFRLYFEYRVLIIWYSARTLSRFE